MDVSGSFQIEIVISSWRRKSSASLGGKYDTSVG